MTHVYARNIAYLDRVIARGRLAHAYLFYGPDGAGMVRLARAMAQALLCPNYCPNYGGLASIVTSLGDADDGCTVCRTIAADIHPALIFLDLAHTVTSEKESRKQIPIDDIRELKRRFSLAPIENAWRVAIIGQADTMSRDAADAFLKLLEEPGGRTLFILTAGSRESVAPTIRSRAVSLGFLGGAPALENEKIGDTVRVTLDAGIPEALALSEKVAGNTSARAEVIAVVMDALRANMRSATGPSEYRSIAGRLQRMLDIAAVMDTTNVNTRLALDTLLLESRFFFRKK